MFRNLFWIEFWIESFLGLIQWKNELSKRIAHPYNDSYSRIRRDRKYKDKDNDNDKDVILLMPFTLVTMVTLVTLGTLVALVALVARVDLVTLLALQGRVYHRFGISKSFTTHC